MNTPLLRYESALRALLRIWAPESFVIVGAMAVAAHIGLHWRGTVDLDLAVASTLDRDTSALEGLGWRRDRAAPQRWIAPDGSCVDLIPAHPSLLKAGGFTWPGGDAQLNLLGFRLAFEDAVTLALAPDLSVRVASLRSLVLLKMSAYLDRPWERDSDLADLAYIMLGFVGLASDERWGDEVLALELDHEDVSPFLLGRRLAGVADAQERNLVVRFLDVIEDPVDRLATLSRMAQRAPFAWRELDTLRSRVAAFRRGFELPTQR